VTAHIDHDESCDWGEGDCPGIDWRARLAARPVVLRWSLVERIEEYRRNDRRLAEALRRAARPRVYFDFRDWWIGYYRGPNHHYVCPLPCLVVRWPRR
jgi:hypothetical protein